MFSTLTAKLIALGIVVAMTIGGWMYVTGLQDQVAQLEKDKVVLVEKINTQNAAVLAIKKTADKKAEEAKADIEKAKAKADKATADAKAYYRAKPSTPADRCKSALDLINGGAK